MNSIISELLELEASSTLEYHKSFVKLRLKILLSYYEQLHQESASDNADLDFAYLEDCSNQLREDLKRHQQSQSVMNVSEVKLPESYNFYHDPMPSEVRLVYDPMLKLMIKI